MARPSKAAAAPLGWCAPHTLGLGDAGVEVIALAFTNKDGGYSYA